jgi:hypothetical protein
MQRAGVGIHSPFLDTSSDFAEIIFAILGVAAKLERRRILERTACGRADAKANGVKFGRKPSSPRISRTGPASALTPARLSAASPAATTQSEHDFRDCDEEASYVTLIAQIKDGVRSPLILRRMTAACVTSRSGRRLTRSAR